MKRQQEELTMKQDSQPPQKRKRQSVDVESSSAYFVSCKEVGTLYIVSQLWKQMKVYVEWQWNLKSLTY